MISSTNARYRGPIESAKIRNATHGIAIQMAEAAEIETVRRNLSQAESASAERSFMELAYRLEHSIQTINAFVQAFGNITSN